MNVGFVGDVVIDNNFCSDIFTDVNSFLKQEYDFLGGNLQTVITEEEEPWPSKKYNFKMNPNNTNILNSFDYFSLSNNHSLDYNLNGLLDTHQNLRKHNILFSGASYNLSNACKPALFRSRKGDILLFSLSDKPEYWKAGHYTNVKSFDLNSSYKGEEGIYYINMEKDNWENIIKNINHYKNLYPYSYVIFSIHWNCNSSEPSLISRQFAEYLLDNGVNVIFGHGSDSPQKINYVNGGVVFYSLGNFIHNLDNSNTYGGIGNIIFKEGQIDEINFIPTEIINKQIYKDDNLVNSYNKVKLINDEKVSNYIQELITE